MSVKLLDLPEYLGLVSLRQIDLCRRVTPLPPPPKPVQILPDSIATACKPEIENIVTKSCASGIVH